MIDKFIFILLKKDFGGSTPLRQKNGVALLMTIFFVLFISFIAVNMSYETLVEYNAAAHGVNRLKARYAAKAGIEISLLRILIYKKVIHIAKGNLSASDLDPIWNFPLAWPPSQFIPSEDEATIATLARIKSAEKDSLMDTQFLTSIESEGSRLDLNDIGSPIKDIQKLVKEQILKIYLIERENNEEFREKHRDVDFNVLVNNIADWVDEDNVSLNGGDESAPYAELVQKQSQFNPSYLPPNQPFKTFEELRMVAGMNDEFYNLLKPRITIFGFKGINVNYAPEEVFRALDKKITAEIAAAIVTRRSSPEEGGPFKDEQDFMKFLSSQGITADFAAQGVPLVFGRVQNFRIVSTGSYAGAQKEITVLTYDLEGVQERMIELLEKQENQETGESEEATSESSTKSQKKKKQARKSIPKGRPYIVQWEER